MTDPYEPDIPEDLRPRLEDVPFDLNRALSSVVVVQAGIPDDAFTAQLLGTERAGHGVLIDEAGLVLTIGYLITEAETVWIIGDGGKVSAAHVLGYDQETGFGLVQSLDRLGLPAMELGNSADLDIGERVIVAGHGGPAQAINANVISKREFAGYWEYLIDEAIFTAPGHPNWGGAGLIGKDGTLRGIGSLAIQQGAPGEPAIDGNMIVPIDLLKPILDDLRTFGRSRNPPRPWLGMFTSEADENLVVSGLVDGGPAYDADVRIGDFVVGVDGAPVTDLASMYRAVWSLGEAGAKVPLTVFRRGDTLDVTVRSINRSDKLKSPRVH